MRAGYLVKRRDATYHFRVLIPSSHLTLRGHEIKEELLEQQSFCTNCNSGHYEYHYYMDGLHECPRCRRAFDIDIPSWRKSVQELIEWSDIVVFQRTTDLHHLRLMREVKGMGKIVVLEADDNYIEVPEWNTGYKYYASRRGVIEEMFRTAHGVSVTTKGLQDRYLEFNSNVVVLPNSLDLEIMDVEPKMPELMVFGRDGKKITQERYEEIRHGKKLIGWGGSPTHQKDLELIVGAVKRLAKRENVVFGFSGYVLKTIIEALDDKSLVLFPLVPVTAYYSLYKTIGFDVGMAPVVNCKFNEGKSNLKVMEYQALGVIPVASDFTTYRDFIHRGYLARDEEYDWFSKLRHALNDEDLPERVAANRKYVEENFDIKNTVHLWESFYQGLLDQKGSA